MGKKQTQIFKVRVIVDATIVFSGILRSDGKIGDILINSDGIFKFISPDFLRIEVQRHHEKLITISKLTLDQVLEAEFQICKSINLIKGLANKGFTNFISTNELWDLRQVKLQRSKFRS